MCFQMGNIGRYWVNNPNIKNSLSINMPNNILRKKTFKRKIVRLSTN